MVTPTVRMMPRSSPRVTACDSDFAVSDWARPSRPVIRIAIRVARVMIPKPPTWIRPMITAWPKVVQ
jgi:hypothetical protein